MGFGPSEARELTYWEYTGRITEYNARNETTDNFDPLAPPDPDLIAYMNEQG